MKKLFSNIGIEKELLAIAAFLATYIIIHFFGELDESLNDYSKLYISQASLDGVDVSARVNLFYKLTIAIAIIVPILYYAFLKLKEHLELRSKDLQQISVISFTGLILQIADVIGVEHSQTVNLLLLLFILSWIAMLIGRQRKQYRFLHSFSFQAASISISVLIFTAFLFLFNSKSFVSENSVALYVVLLVIVVGLVSLLKNLFQFSHRRLFAFAIGLCAIPIIAFISVELQFYFKLNQGEFIAYKWFFLGTVSMVIIAFGLYNWKRRINISTSLLLSRFYVPFAFVSFLLLAFYTPYLEQSSEMYELANPANSQMKIFNFYEIPFVDFMSSHMFSEQFYGIIYNSIFGYNGSLDFLAYRFLYTVIFFIISYCFVSKIFNQALISAVFIMLFPFVNALFSVHLFFGILLFFSFWKLLNKQSFVNYFLFFILIVSLIIWRLDTGVAALIAGLLIVPISFIIEKTRLNSKALLLSSASVLLIVIVAVISVILLRSPDYLIENFTKALHYVSAHQAHGYSIIAKEYNQQFYLYHVIFPVVAVLSSLYCIYLLKVRTSFSMNERFTTYASLFLFLLYLVNFPRGIVRHGFMEKMDSFLVSTFFLACVILIVSEMKNNRAVQKYLMFFALSFALMFGLKYFPLPQGLSNIERVLTQSSLLNLDHYFTEESFHGRIIGDTNFEEEKFGELRSFMDENLSSDQTFLDFSNTPMLYYYCQRDVPAYFCQNLQNTVDDFLQLEHIKELNAETVPLVVYSNYPPNWFDRTDGIPNAMRQYLIAEYIYKNYEPMGILNDFSVWKAKGEQIESLNLEADTVITSPKRYNYKKSAAHINKHFSEFDKTSLSLIAESSIPNSEGRLILDGEIAHSSGVFLKLEFENTLEGKKVEVELFHQNILIGTTLFTCSESELEYMLPLSNHYLWHIYPPQSLRIKTDEGMSISKVEHYKDNRNEYP